MRRGLSVLAVLAVVSACSQPEPPAPPPPPPPPPPVAELEPPDEYYFNYVLPPRDAAGAYVTPNSDIGPLEQLFHFRSALNVAALSCRHLPGFDLAPKYNAFIKSHANPLRNANQAIEAKFRREHGSEGARVRDSHMTELYNHFARPATLEEFCPLAEQHLDAVQALPSAELEGYALPALAGMESIFQRHYAVVEEYQRSYRERMRERGLDVPPMPNAIGAETMPVGEAGPEAAPVGEAVGDPAAAEVEVGTSS